MPGKPPIPFFYQQKTYVNQRVYGKSVDKHEGGDKHLSKR